MSAIDMATARLLDTRGRRNRKLADKECEECGTLFRPRDSGSRYCSRPCLWKNNFVPPRKKPTWEQHVVRFWKNVNKNPDGCWEWLGVLDRHNYGQFSRDGLRRQAHIIAYELIIGEVPKGLELDHLCRNPKCVNPKHLEAVTHRENILRGVAARKSAATLRAKEGV